MLNIPLPTAQSLLRESGNALHLDWCLLILSYAGRFSCILPRFTLPHKHCGHVLPRFIQMLLDVLFKIDLPCLPAENNNFKITNLVAIWHDCKIKALRHLSVSCLTDSPSSCHFSHEQPHVCHHGSLMYPISPFSQLRYLDWCIRTYICLEHILSQLVKSSFPEWSREALLEKWINDPAQACIEAGVSLPGNLDPENCVELDMEEPLASSSSASPVCCKRPSPCRHMERCSVSELSPDELTVWELGHAISFLLRISRAANQLINLNCAGFSARKISHFLPLFETKEKINITHS